MEIYGHNAKIKLKLLSAPYHTALRRSLRAFPTTPLKNIFAETGLTSIADNAEDCIGKLYAKLITTSNNALRKDVQLATLRKRIPKIPSTIHLCLKFAKDNNLPLQRVQISKHRNPPWLLKEACFINNLVVKRKANTSREEYKSIFSEIAANYRAMGWKLIYTDGSKTEQTSYAVVKEQNEIITYGLLFPFCSIFTAEAVAIFNAFLYAIQNKGKFIVCTDSLSCFSAIQNYNNSNYIIDFIRETLTTKPQKIKITYVDSWPRRY